MFVYETKKKIDNVDYEALAIMFDATAPATQESDIDILAWKDAAGVAHVKLNPSKTINGND